MSIRRPKTRSPIGTATELVSGCKKTTACYGTFADDIPDRHFRLRLSFVEHDGDFPTHGHEYSELTLVLGGTATHFTPFEQHPLEAGDVFVIHGRGRHSFSAARGLKLCNIMFDPRQFFAGQRQLEGMMGWQALFELGPREQRPKQIQERLHLTRGELGQVLPVITAMKEEYELHAEGWQATLTGHFLVLVTQLCRVYGRRTKEQTSPLLRFARVVAHIQQGLGQALRLEDLAALAHVSVRHFEREFKRVYNMTPVRFINQLRLHEACERLQDPDRDVTDVAVELGYSSVSFFSKKFKTAIGQTPSEYRRRKLMEIGKQSRRSLMIRALREVKN
jgi:AraC-like DNA-binding protein/quercetin dioxygenase-like cupin family protein